MQKVTDSKGNEIKIGSLVMAKKSSVVREVLGSENGQFIFSFTGKTQVIRAKRQGSNSQDWAWLRVDLCEVVDG